MSIRTLVVNVLAEMGLPAPSDDIIQTMLILNGHFAGFKFRYEGGYAVMPADEGMLELFNDEGRLLRTVVMKAQQSAA